MSYVVIDRNTRQKLLNLTEPAELRDEEGQVLGHFIPPRPDIITAEEGECPYSDAEIEQLRQQTGGRPLREIWKDLGRTA